MTKIDVLELVETPVSRKPFYQNTKFVTILIVTGVILVVVGLSLGIVYGSQNNSKTTNQAPTLSPASSSQTSTLSPASSSQTSTLSPASSSQTSTLSPASSSQASTLSSASTIQPVNKNSRIDCLAWLKNSSSDLEIENNCSKINYCTYQSIDGNKEYPSCFIDKTLFTSNIRSEIDTELGKSYLIETNYGNRINSAKLKIDFEFLDDDTIRFKIFNPDVNDYEVPIKINKPNSGRAQNPKYEIEVNVVDGFFNFKIIRSSSKTVIWDTSLGPIIFENLNRLISTKLPSEYVYGLGENRHESFKHNLNYQNWPVFARDEPPEIVPYANLYGSQPFYTCMENDGKSHGVVLVNSNAFDYELIPNPGLIYRVTGGILDFYVFLGPDPEKVVQQYTQYFGKTFFPPYWALGFQISRYGYKDPEDMRAVVKGFEDNNIPLDTQVADIDHYQDRKDFTIDQNKWKNLSKYFDELHDKGMKTVMILDPALIVNDTSYWPFTTGFQNDVFIKWPNGTSPDYDEMQNDIMIGYCWPPAKVAYPDFFKKSTQQWWIDSIMRHYNDELKFDGLWIDMNEPAVFGTNEEKPFNWLPSNGKPWSLKCPDDEYELVKTKASYVYRQDNKLSDKTLCMAGLQGENNTYKHFDVHNMYGYTESIPTYEAARMISGSNSRGFVITRSTFIGSGQYGGHWTGDNHSLWRHLYYSIIGMLEFNLFGIPYVGADICGFWLNTTAEMCARWSSLGAFYPFSRNHNNEEAIDQDPAYLGQQVISAARNSLNIRYRILPYYYTLFYKAHLFGNTVARPLFHEFPSDKNTYSIDKQFLIGSAFLITPVIEEGMTNVTGYFPMGIWYDYYEGTKIHDDQNTGNWINVNSPIDYIPLHVRGGFILPTQDEARTTEISRKNPFGLIVAPDNYGEAKGDLFYDDGKSEIDQDKYFLATFFLRENVLKMNIEHNTYSEMSSKRLNTVNIFSKPNQKLIFILNNEIVDKSKVIFHANYITLSDLDITMTDSFELKWTLETVDINSKVPFVDCSIQNDKVTLQSCPKNCSFDDNFAVPCFIPNNIGGYYIESSYMNESYKLEKIDSFSLYDSTVEEILIIVTHAKINQIHKMTRIEVLDANEERFRVPLKLNYQPNTDQNEKFLTINVKTSNINQRAYIEAINENGKKLFTTENSEQGLIFSDQFIQIILNLVDYKNLYGFGENTHSSFRHTFSYSNWWGVFGRDQPTGGKYINNYGAQPFFMAVDENTGRAFGTLILNSNAQEYGLLPPSAISYRTLGGILDFYIMEESSPENLIMAYTSLIGTTYMPPYWALGFQLCRYGYKNIGNLKAAVNRTLNAKIPLDIQYADIDHFDDNLDFTYDKTNFAGLPEYIDELKENGIKFITILDPAINSEKPGYDVFLRGKANDVYIKWPKIEGQNPQVNELNGNNEYLLGYVWPSGKTVFPDFFKSNTSKWWKDEIKMHYNVLKFDGLWIDMNEPANFDTNLEKPFNWPQNKPPWNLVCPTNTYDDPPYLPLIAKFGNSKRISDKTICMMALQGQENEYKHYDVHNLYGWSQSQPTLDALRELLKKRSFVLSRSNYPSSGTSSVHWLGDNYSGWDHLKYNIIGMLEFNLFGISYVGADICGFFGDTTPEMCTRWMQLGAFNTFFRNHNGFNGIEQDPAALGLDVALASKKVVEIRYKLLPFLYTLFYNANKNGGTVIRSLMHEFPTDKRTLDIDRQFMWGSSLLISPVLEINSRSVYAYFPKARWFDYYNGKEIIQTGRIHELDAPLDHINLHIKGGSIVVTQEPGMNTELSRTNPFGLIIAPDTTGDIEFEFYYDDGDSIDLASNSSIIKFTYQSLQNGDQKLIAVNKKNDFKFLQSNKLDTIRLFGIDQVPTMDKINYSISPQQTINLSDFKYNLETKELIFRNIGISLMNLSNFMINIQK